MLKAILFSLLFLAHAAFGAETITGRVVGVADGDTITVLVAGREQIKVRLANIDAPEKSQAYGQASKVALSDAIFGRDVRVDISGKDKYGRSIGSVIFRGEDINLRQIRRGYAWAYRKYLTRPDYLDEESFARKNRRGLWVAPSPVPPWDFRHERKGAGR